MEITSFCFQAVDDSVAYRADKCRNLWSERLSNLVDVAGVPDYTASYWYRTDLQRIVFEKPSGV